MFTSAGAAPWPMNVTNGLSTVTRSTYLAGARKMFARSVSVCPTTASTALCTVGKAPLAPLGFYEVIASPRAARRGEHDRANTRERAAELLPPIYRGPLPLHQKRICQRASQVEFALTSVSRTTLCSSLAKAGPSTTTISGVPCYTFINHSFAASMSPKARACPAGSKRNVTSAPASRSIAARRFAFSIGTIGSSSPEEMRMRV